MSDEERRNEQERTMFDASLLERIQEREREEQEAEAAQQNEDSTAGEAPGIGSSIPPVPPPPPPEAIGGDGAAAQGDIPMVPPPPPAEADQDPIESRQIEDQAEGSELEEPEPSDPDSMADANEVAPGEQEDASSDQEPTGVGPEPSDSTPPNNATGDTAPSVEPVDENSDDFPSNADGSLRAIQTPDSMPSSTDRPPESSDLATRNLSPVPTQQATKGEGEFSDSATEERDPIEASGEQTPLGAEATGSSLEPTRPGLATNLTTEANLDDDSLGSEPSQPTRPQTGSAAEENADLWAESSVKQLTRSDRKTLKAEETAMLPTPDSPETGDVIPLESEPETTDEEYGLTLICDDGGVAPVHVKAEPVVLGRGQAADVTILESTLSRKHCQLELRGSRIWVTDLGSGNGTYINDERLVGAAELKQGDRLRLGLKVSFSLPSDDQTNPAAMAQDEVSAVTPGNASASGPTLMPNSAGFSTTDGHGVNALQPGHRIKEWAPLVVGCLIFVVGVTTQVILHQRTAETQTRLNQADAKLMEGVSLFQKGQFKDAETAVKMAGLQDPNHPMLTRYKDKLATLVHQESQLDDAAKLIEQGNLERASALLVALDVEEQLEPKSKALVDAMGKARSKSETKAIAELIEQKKFEEARALLATLKQAGADPETVSALEAQLPTAKKVIRPAPRRQSTLPTGPLNRVHRALRAGQIEEAFRINRDLASSGVKEAARLEGNIAELRELLGLAETAVQRRDHVRALTQTSRALKLLKQISPTASGARNKLRTLRAKAFQAEAQQHGRAGRACDARKSLDQAARFNRNIPGLTNGFRVVENHGASELAEARDEIQRGASLASVRHKLEMAVCTHAPNSKVSKEARRLLRSR